MNGGLTLDTGALVALERRRDRILRLLRAAAARAQPVTVPTVVLAERWRGRTDVRAAILAALLVEPLDAALALAAGEAMTAVRGATLVDAIVMASAARRGDVVVTGDIEDLSRLTRQFPSVRLLAI